MFRNKLSRRMATAAFFALFAIWAVIAFSAVRYIRERADDAVRKEPTAPVAVAAAEIGPGRPVQAEQIEIRLIPLTQRHPDAVASMAEVAGKLSTQTIFPGEQVLRSKLADAAELGALAFRISPDRLAVAVSFDDVMGAGGLILPGDFVDVIAVFDDQVRSVKEAGFVLQGVKVLAVARQVQSPQTVATPSPEKAGLAGAAPDDARRARSVTLEVTPEEAERLVLAERFGSLKLVLRPPRADSAPPPPQITIDQVFMSEAPNGAGASTSR